MKTKVLSVEEIRSVELSNLPIGAHVGVWGGYEVTFNVDSKMYRLRTEIGIRTIAAPCIVRVENGEVTVESP